MSVRVAINGFGRTGRAAFRAAYERGADIEWVAINDVADPHCSPNSSSTTLCYGPFATRSRSATERLSWTATASKRRVSRPRPSFRGTRWGWMSSSNRRAASVHGQTPPSIWRPAPEKVIVSAPAKEPDVTVALGVNFAEVYDPEAHRIISNASCTTNCLAPVAKVLHETFGIRHGLMTTVHAYTGDQELLDGPHKDYRRARAAACNLVPTTTGAAKALGLVVPELEGKLQGYAVRVPVPTGSLVDLTVELEYPTTVDEVNEAFAERADAGELEGILAYSEEPLVSSDIVKSPYSAIFDAGLTTVIDSTQAKVVAWYDNEWGYSNRLIELAQRVLVPVSLAV